MVRDLQKRPGRMVAALVLRKKFRCKGLPGLRPLRTYGLSFCYKVHTK